MLCLNPHIYTSWISGERNLEILNRLIQSRLAVVRTSHQQRIDQPVIVPLVETAKRVFLISKWRQMWERVFGNWDKHDKTAISTFQLLWGRQFPHQLKAFLGLEVTSASLSSWQTDTRDIAGRIWAKSFHVGIQSITWLKHNAENSLIALLSRTRKWPIYFERRFMNKSNFEGPSAKRNDFRLKLMKPLPRWDDFISFLTKSTRNMRLWYMYNPSKHSRRDRFRWNVNGSSNILTYGVISRLD